MRNKVCAATEGFSPRVDKAQLGADEAGLDPSILSIACLVDGFYSASSLQWFQMRLATSSA